jgi:hypothetical protein
MKRVITISYTVDSPDAKSIGRLASPLVFKGLYGLDLCEPLVVGDVSVANEPPDNCPIHDAFETAGLEVAAKLPIESDQQNKEHATSEVTSATLVDRYERARQEQSEARRQLQERHRWLLNELETCEKAMVNNTTSDAANVSVAEMTRHVLALHPRGVSAVNVIREVQAAKPNVDAKVVHAELRRARRTGTRRNFRYFPPLTDGHELDGPS